MAALWIGALAFAARITDRDAEAARSRTPPGGARISLEHKRRSPAYGAD